MVTYQVYKNLSNQNGSHEQSFDPETESEQNENGQNPASFLHINFDYNWSSSSVAINSEQTQQK
jgi:hypothetical protein